MKRVYIAHGFSLAILDESLLDKRFDEVQAWKYGPVIPSVYHSFKYYRNNPITDKTVVIDWDESKGTANYIEPKLEDKTSKKIVEIVYNRYKNNSDRQMVSFTHDPGTPWSKFYIEGRNCIIPDDYTKIYYKILVDKILSDSKK
jgi:uncharacterized phage-associated protein